MDGGLTVRLEDLTVEIRDRDLRRVGAVTDEFLNLSVQDNYNAIGKWELTLPAEHHMCAALQEPGAGIVVYAYGNVMFSGPMENPEYAASSNDLEGSIKFAGVSDSVYLGDYLAFPQPANADPYTQSSRYDVRIGKAETLMHQFVDANMGTSAPPERMMPRFDMASDGGRGIEMSKSARYESLGWLLQFLGAYSDIGFRIVQQPHGNLLFETFAVVDRSDVVRLDVTSGTLSSAKTVRSGPSVTHVLAAGPGNENDRTIRMFTNDATVQAQMLWGRRIERYVDVGSDATTAAKLQDAADELLVKEGLDRIAGAVVANDQGTMGYGRDWFLGDRITVVINRQEMVATVTGMILKANRDGLVLAAVVGDQKVLSNGVQLNERLAAIDERLSRIERLGGWVGSGSAPAGDAPDTETDGGSIGPGLEWVTAPDGSLAVRHKNYYGANDGEPADRERLWPFYVEPGTVDETGEIEVGAHPQSPKWSRLVTVFGGTDTGTWTELRDTQSWLGRDVALEKVAWFCDPYKDNGRGISSFEIIACFAMGDFRYGEMFGHAYCSIEGAGFSVTPTAVQEFNLRGGRRPWFRFGPFTKPGGGTWTPAQMRLMRCRIGMTTTGGFRGNRSWDMRDCYLYSVSARVGYNGAPMPPLAAYERTLPKQLARYGGVVRGESDDILGALRAWRSSSSETWVETSPDTGDLSMLVGFDFPDHGQARPVQSIDFIVRCSGDPGTFEVIKFWDAQFTFPASPPTSSTPFPGGEIQEIVLGPFTKPGGGGFTIFESQNFGAEIAFTGPGSRRIYHISKRFNYT